MDYVKLFNDGNWREGSSGATFTVENPAIEEVITYAAQATSPDTIEAIESAARGFQLWRRTDPWVRSETLRKVALRLRADLISCSQI